MEQFLVFLQKSPYHMLLFGTAVITGGMLVWPVFGRLFRPGREVSVLEAVQLINRRDAIVIDVREAAEYAAGHIAGARHVLQAQLEERVKELEKFKMRPIIVSCRGGGRAASVGGTLRKHGFGEVFVLRGGITAWEQAGMPVEK